MRLPAPSMMPKCRAFTRARSGMEALGCAVAGIETFSGEGERRGAVAGAEGVSHNHNTTNTITGTPQKINVVAQASLPRNCSITGTVVPAATASPMIKPSLNRARARPMCAGNQRRASTGTPVCDTAMPRHSRQQSSLSIGKFEIVLYEWQDVRYCQDDRAQVEAYKGE